MNKKFIGLSLITAFFIVMSGCSKNNDNAVVSETTVSAVTTASETTSVSIVSETTSVTCETTAKDPALMSTPMMWYTENTDTGGQIYFLGSIHCGDENTNYYPDYVWNAYNSSDYLAVECDMVAYKSDIEAQQTSIKSYAYSDGSKIGDHIDPQLLSEAKKLLGENQMYNVFFDYYIPEFWSELFSSISVEKAGMNYDYGVDTFFLNTAYEENKTILEVESVEFQTAMVTGFDDKLQELLLRESVKSALSGEDAESLKELYARWKLGNHDELERMLFEEYDNDDNSYTEEELALFADYNAQMTTNRNIGMADTAEEYLNSGKKVFYIVGTAHFLGYDGIISLLEDRGHTVEKLY